MTIVLAIIGIVFTAATLWVGWQNMQMAKVKLYHDLYDRRYKVYDAVRRFLGDVAAKGTVTNDALARFAIDTADAVFLFDAELVGHLKEVQMQAGKLHAVTLTAEMVAVAPEHVKANAHRVTAETFAWLTYQLTDLTSRFKPFLQLPEVRTVPLWLERLWRRLRP